MIPFTHHDWSQGPIEISGPGGSLSHGQIPEDLEYTPLIEWEFQEPKLEVPNPREVKWDII